MTPSNPLKNSMFVMLLFLVGVGLVTRALWLERVDDEGAITIYSGRSEELIRPLIDQFTEDTGIPVHIRYGQTAEMAATIMEEGRNSPADVFFAQDAGALGALTQAGRLVALPDDLLQAVETRFRSPRGYWIGVSGRARVVVYNPDRVASDQLPDDLAGFCDEDWRRRVGWAPSNGSFQAFITSLRITEGEDAAAAWLTCMRDNHTRDYARNTAIIAAVEAGEIDAGLVNHYYIHAMRAQRDAAMNLRNHYFDSGVLVNVAGVGIVDTSQRKAQAEQFVRYLLAETAQRYFTDQTFEYPLATQVEPNPALPPLHTLSTPDMDLSDLDDLGGTLRLLEKSGVL